MRDGIPPGAKYFYFPTYKSYFLLPLFAGCVRLLMLCVKISFYTTSLSWYKPVQYQSWGIRK